jgi:hypothetical protein
MRLSPGLARNANDRRSLDLSSLVDGSQLPRRAAIINSGQGSTCTTSTHTHRQKGTWNQPQLIPSAVVSPKDGSTSKPNSQEFRSHGYLTAKQNACINNNRFDLPNISVKTIVVCWGFVSFFETRCISHHFCNTVYIPVVLFYFVFCRWFIVIISVIYLSKTQLVVLDGDVSALVVLIADSMHCCSTWTIVDCSVNSISHIHM